jgi:hypothetical protein
MLHLGSWLKEAGLLLPSPFAIDFALLSASSSSMHVLHFVSPWAHLRCSVRSGRSSGRSLSSPSSLISAVHAQQRVLAT